MTTPPIRVTFVVPDLRAGGAERHVATLVEHLDPVRFRARVVCLGGEGELFADAAAHVPTISFGLTKRQALRSLLRLTRELRRTRAQVVVVAGYNAEMLGRLAASLARVPHRVVWVHNFDDQEPRGWVRRWGDRLLEGATDAYFGVARRQLPYLTDELGHPGSKVRTIHNGVDPVLFTDERAATAGRDLRADLGLSPDDVVIGIVAGLRPVKNHDLFLRAAAIVAEQVPRARFLLVGDGEQRAHLEALTRELGLEDRVVLAGFRSDVAGALHATDVVVLSSDSEAFPISLLEAMAASRPVVSTAVGGIPEIVEEGVTGHLVPPRDAAALASRLVELARDPRRREVLGRAGRARVEREFTLARHVEEAQRALTDVVRGTTATTPLRLTMVMDEAGVGGVELVTLWMFGVMDRAVVVPRLVCLRTGGSLAEDYREAGVEVDVLDRTGRFDLRTLPRLVRALRRSRADAILLAHHHRASLVLARVAALLAGVRVVVVAAHGMDLVPLGDRVLPRSTVETLRAVSALVVLAPSQGAYLRRYEGVGARPRSTTREVAIPNGIRMPGAPDRCARSGARRLLGLREDSFVVGIVARLAAEKAHEVLLTAVAQLVRTTTDLQLVVVGGGPREAELRSLARELGIEDHVLFTGLRRDVTALLPAFDVSCLSSVHEAAPIGIIESMAAGLPVVASACGAIPDMIEHGTEGLLFPPRDSSGLALAIQTLADDPGLRARMGAAARDRAVRDFDIEQTARAYEQLLEELVRR